MWLSEKAAARRAGAASAGTGIVSIGGTAPAVYTDGEHRALRVLAPMGMEWQLRTGDDVLLLETDDGERYILGTVDEGGTLGEGELCLKCGGTWLKIGADGSISAEGEVHICGDVFLTGRLFLNGTEVQAGGSDD